MKNHGLIFFWGEEMAIQKTTFECNREGLCIKGTVFRDETIEKQPTIIISHGFMSNQTTVINYAKSFAEIGYAAFTFDFCGGGIKGKSDGKSEDMTVFTEVKDLFAVIDHIKTLPYVDKKRITLMGCSQGGFVSGMVAAKRKEEIEKLILFYPALCIPDDARNGKMLGFSFDPQNMTEILSKFPMKIGRDYAKCVLDIDSVKEISGYDGEVLIVHGTDDKIVNYSYAKKAKEAFGDEKCDLLLISGAGHGFRGNADEVAIVAAKEFLMGRKEVLTVDVRLLGHEITRKGLYSKVVLPFGGEATGKWFTGKIQDGANDTQERKGFKPIKFVADYVIDGKDHSGEKCKVHVINTFDGKTWKPTVSTDSKALSFLNGADCTAVLEQRKVGPIVHIFCKI